MERQVEPVEVEDRTPKFGSKEHNRLVKQLNEWLDFSEKGKREREDNLRKAYKHLRSFLPKTKNWPHATRVYDPIWKGSLETAVAEEMRALYQDDRLFRYAPEGDSDWDMAEMASAGAQVHLNTRKPKGPTQEILLTRRMAGTALVYVYWRLVQRKKKVWRRVPILEPMPVIDPASGLPVMDQAGQPVYEEQQVGEGWEVVDEVVDVIDAPWFEEVPFWEAFPDHLFPDVQSGRFFIRRQMRDARYVKGKLDSGQWNKENFDSAPKNNSEPLSNVMKSLQWQQECGIDTDITEEELDSGKWYEELVCFTDDVFYTMLNRSVIVSVKPNPFFHAKKPILHLKNTLRLSGEFYGLSDWECVSSLITNIQEMRNAGNTDALMSIYGITKATHQTKLEDLRPRPGQIVRVKDMSDFEMVTRPSQGLQIAGGILNLDRGSIDNALGTSDALRGALPQDNRQHATTIVQAVQNAGNRLAMGIGGIVEDFVVPLGEFYFELMVQFSDGEFLVRSTDHPDAQKILFKADAIRTMKTSVVAVAATAQSQELVLKRLLELLGVTVQSQSLAVNNDELVRCIVELMVPTKARRILLSPEQQAQRQQEMAMQQMQQQMQQQGLMNHPSPGGPQGAWRGPSEGDGGNRELANDRQQGVNVSQ